MCIAVQIKGELRETFPPQQIGEKQQECMNAAHTSLFPVKGKLLSKVITSEHISHADGLVANRRDGTARFQTRRLVKKTFCAVTTVFPFHSEPFSRQATGVSTLQLLDLFLDLPPFTTERTAK